MLDGAFKGGITNKLYRTFDVMMCAQHPKGWSVGIRVLAQGLVKSLLNITAYMLRTASPQLQEVVFEVTCSAMSFVARMDSTLSMQTSYDSAEIKCCIQDKGLYMFS